MSKDDRSTPRSKAGGVVFNEIQKAIRLFRLNPHESANCTKAIDETLEVMKKFVDRYGRLDAEITRDGLMVDDSLIVRTGDPTSDLSMLLFPLGFRSVGMETLLPRAVLVDFVSTLSTPYAENEADVTFEPDLTAALWRREVKEIDYRVHDQLAPAALTGRLDATLAPLGRRIQELSAAIGQAGDAEEVEARRFIDDQDKRARSDDPKTWGTRGDKIADFIAGPLGAGRRALAAEVTSASQAELIDRASEITVRTRLGGEGGPEADDVATFLGAAAVHALTKGDLDRAVALIERAQAADAGTGTITPTVSARLGADSIVAAIVAALEKPAASLAPEALAQYGLRILKYLPASGLVAATKQYPQIANEAVRAVLRAYFATKLPESPEPIVAITLHTDKKLIEEIILVLAKGGVGSPGWKQLDAIAKATDGKPRTAIAIEIAERVSGEKERKDHVRVLANDPDKVKRLQAAEQLKASGGGGKSFDELAAYIVEDRFGSRDDDEVDVVLSAFTAIGKVRSVRVLTELAEKKARLFRRTEIRRVAVAAQKQLDHLKGRGGS